MEWLSDNAWIAWTAIAVVLGIAEMLSLDLVLIMLAIGAVAGAVSSTVSPSIWIDLAVAAAVSVGMIGAVRPPLVKRFHSGPELTTGHSALVGRKGVVTEPVGEYDGRVRLAGEIWTARCFEPGTTIDQGTEVEVFAIEGATAVVYPTN